MKEVIEGIGYLVIEMVGTYRRTQTKFKIQCSENHQEYVSTYDNLILRGRRCKKCQIKYKRDIFKVSLEEAKKHSIRFKFNPIE